MLPIWKDYYVDFGAVESQNYIITDDSGNTLYAGKAYRRPGETTCKIRVNDVCRNYLSTSLPPSLNNGTFYADPGLLMTFHVKSADGKTTYASPAFTPDWSYEEMTEAREMFNDCAISGEADRRQLLIVSGFDMVDQDVELLYKDGTTNVLTLPLVDFSKKDYNADFAILGDAPNGNGTCVLDLACYPELAAVCLGNTTYKIATECSRYVLYYVNAYGGWDSLVVKGTAKEVDSYTRSTHQRNYDNGTATARGKVNYLNSYTKKLTLQSGWLDDKACGRMHHLLGSTNVYLYDTILGEMRPVVLTDTTCEYKSYRTNGNKLTSYTINVELAQERARR